MGDADAEAAQAFRLALAADVHESDLEEDEQDEQEHVEDEDDDQDEDPEEAEFGLDSHRSRLRRFVDAEAEEGDEDSDEEDAMLNEEGMGDETGVRKNKSTKIKRSHRADNVDPADPEVRTCLLLLLLGLFVKGGRLRVNGSCVGCFDGTASLTM